MMHAQTVYEKPKYDEQKAMSDVFDARFSIQNILDSNTVSILKEREPLFPEFIRTQLFNTLNILLNVSEYYHSKLYEKNHAFLIEKQNISEKDKELALLQEPF